MKFIEMIAEGVHDAWWEEKEKQGFHSPKECKSKNKESYINSSQQGKDRFLDTGLNPKLYRWCNKCHTDMYPYDELSEGIKEYDRVTAKAVLITLEKHNYTVIKDRKEENNIS